MQKLIEKKVKKRVEKRETYFGSGWLTKTRSALTRGRRERGGREVPSQPRSELGPWSKRRRPGAADLNRCAVTAAPSTDGQVDLGAAGGRGTH